MDLRVAVVVAALDVLRVMSVATALGQRWDKLDETPQQWFSLKVAVSRLTWMRWVLARESGDEGSSRVLRGNLSVVPSRAGRVVKLKYRGFP